MVVKHCMVCVTSDNRYPDKMSPGTYFIPSLFVVKDGMTKFDKNVQKQKTERAKKWIHACGRTDLHSVLQITKDRFVCSLHFAQPMEENADPIIAILSVERKTSERKARKRKLREPAPKAPSLDISSLLNRELSECEMDVTAEISVESLMTCDNSTQTVAVRKAFVAARLENKILHNEMLIKTKPITKELNLLSFRIIYGDRKKFKYFTDVYPEQFDTLFEFLGPAKHSLVYWGSKSVNGDQKPSKIKKLSLREQMFVTPLRLRRGYRLYTLAHFYSVSEVTIRRIFTTWIMFLFQHFKDYQMLMFPDRHSFKMSNPAVFRHFKNIRCIVDCTESFCEVPRDYGRQGNFYSSYKHHCTMKCLIAITPSGGTCFVSELLRECG